MTASDFTSYLGKEVSFLVPEEFIKSRYSHNRTVRYVTGTVIAVSLFQPLVESEFLIKETDEFYFFKDATFLEVLSNPTQ